MEFFQSPEINIKLRAILEFAVVLFCRRKFLNKKLKFPNAKKYFIFFLEITFKNVHKSKISEF
jgi:hypothetical protein